MFYIVFHRNEDSREWFGTQNTVLEQDSSIVCLLAFHDFKLHLTSKNLNIVNFDPVWFVWLSSMKYKLSPNSVLHLFSQLQSNSLPQIQHYFFKFMIKKQVIR